MNDTVHVTCTIRGPEAEDQRSNCLFCSSKEALAHQKQNDSLCFYFLILFVRNLSIIIFDYI